MSAGVSQRIRRADDTRGAILEAAQQLFAERGFAETRLEDIAVAVGIRRASLLYHFGNKAEIYVAVFDALCDELNRRHRRALAAVEGPVERLDEGLREWVRFIHDRPAFLRLLLRELAGTKHLPPAAMARTLGGLVGEAAAGIREGQERGIFQDVDVVDVFLAVTGTSALHMMIGPGLATMAQGRASASGPDALHSRLVTLARKILGAPAPRLVNRDQRKRETT
jgi:AcrR family transcriptional regulator